MRYAKLGDLGVRVTGGADGDGGGDGPVVILLHGFGAPGDDLVGLGPALASAGTDVRFVYPEGLLRLGPPYPGGRAWWWIDLDERMRRQAARNGERDIAEVPEGLGTARAKIEELLAAALELLHPAPGKLVLGGFSQGAMLSLDVALHSPVPLAGLVLMSGTHIAAQEWAARFESRRSLPVFMSHGTDDPLLPFAVAEGLRATLVAGGIPVEWVPFPGGHGIPARVLERVGGFLARVLG